MAPFVFAWCALAIGATWVRYRDPFGPSVDHPGYGENHAGDLAMVLLWAAIEFAGLAAFSQPWRARHRFVRVAVVTTLYTPWAAISMVVAMHAGSIFATFMIGRLAVAALLIIYALVAGLQALGQRAAAG